MTLKEIKHAVDSGTTVHWSHVGYSVVRDKRRQYHIVFTRTGNAIRLTHADGITLNGKEDEFYTA